MRFRCLALLPLILSFAMLGQQTASTFTATNFASEVLKYRPIQREDVTQSAYERAVVILDATRSSTKGSPDNFTYADFWNVTSAFVLLKEPTGNIRLAFSEAIKRDPAAICGYVKALGTSKLDVLIPETFLPFDRNCLDQAPPTDHIDSVTYAAQNHLDAALVAQMQQINLDDQHFRNLTPFDNVQQQALDIKNQQAIAVLFAKYKTYIGRSLVGKEYESVMWAVIQHSNLAMMQKFLPVVQNAVSAKEIDVVPLKMLIDRVYTIQAKQQIFGSQGNFLLADEKTRAAVKRQYGLE